MNGPWSNEWARSGCRGRHTFICYVLHSCRTPARGVWPLQVATVQHAPYFDNVQSVLLQSNNIFSSHNSKMQELQRDSSPTGTIITKQILALLLARPQKGRDCAKVNALEISSIYYLWTINWSPGDKGKKRKENKIKGWQWNILFLDVVPWINYSHIAQIPAKLIINLN